jgi:hypothetical protein
MNGSGSFRNPRLQVSSGRELGFQLAWQYVLVLRLKRRRLALDVTHPPVRGDGSAFTKETFESEQASLKHPVTGTGGLEAIRLEMITPWSDWPPARSVRTKPIKAGFGLTN